MTNHRDWKLGGLTVQVLENGFGPKAKPYAAWYVTPRRHYRSSIAGALRSMLHMPASDSSLAYRAIWCFHKTMLESAGHNETLLRNQ